MGRAAVMSAAKAVIGASPGRAGSPLRASVDRAMLSTAMTRPVSPSWRAAYREYSPAPHPASRKTWPGLRSRCAKTGPGSCSQKLVGPYPLRGASSVCGILVLLIFKT